jgi:hypothetical protein
MQLDEYQEKLKLSYENSFIGENIYELLELFSDAANLKDLSYYKYDYEYNDFFHKFDISSSNIGIPKQKKNSYKLILKDKKTIFGYLLINQKIKSNSILKKLLSKVIKNLKKEKEIQKKIYGNELPFNIYLFHDEDLNLFAENLKVGLEGLFNVDITKDSSIEKYFEILKSKETKHIIIFLINDDKMIKNYEDKIKSLNELIVVIGPNNHLISMYCGKLGIENYIPIHEFKAENLKHVILSKKNTLLNKNKFGNKIIAIGGISGGIGSTTIAMNMSDLISKNVPNKNLLYIDLSTTKAISNLFLE